MGTIFAIETSVAWVHLVKTHKKPLVLEIKDMPINNSDPTNQDLGGVKGRPATPEEIAKREGYVQGRSDEDYVQRNLRSQESAIAQSRADDSAASGLLLGLLIALLAAGAGAAFYFLGGDRTPTAPVAAPPVQKETIKEKTIIEKQSSPPAVSAPDVNITVPDVKAPDVNITNETPPAAEAPPAAPNATPKATEQPAQQPAQQPAGQSTEQPAEPSTAQ